MKKLTVLFLGVISSLVIHAQTPGTLDLSFGNNGMVLTNYNVYNNYSRSSVIQDDGKILLAGYSQINDFSYPTFARYMPDGSLDASFGSGGIVIFLPVNAEEFMQDVILQPDGKILALGHRCGDSCNIQVLRLNPNGSFDNTFNGSGHLTVDFGQYESYGHCLSLQDDGKILAAGFVMDADIHVHSAFCRINTDGTLDNTFGTGGKVIMNLGDMHNYSNNIAIQGDKFIVGGMSYEYDGGYEYVTLSRYNSNGTPDATFGQNGTVNIQVFLDTWILTPRGGMCIDDQDRILYGVYVSGIQSADFALFRFLPNGQPDNSFGEYGLTVTDMERNAYINALTIQYDGKIIAGGQQHKETYGSDFAMVRYLENGDPDLSFGIEGTGIVITDPNTGGASPFGIITSLDISEEGLIIASGYASNFLGNTDFAMAGYYSGLNVGIQNPENKILQLGIHPNPFANEATIIFSLEVESDVKADIFDARGIHIANIANRPFIPGTHQLRWNAEGIGAGIYILKMTVEDKVYTSRMLKQ